MPGIQEGARFLSSVVLSHSDPEATLGMDDLREVQPMESVVDESGVRGAPRPTAASLHWAFVNNAAPKLQAATTCVTGSIGIFLSEQNALVQKVRETTTARSPLLGWPVRPHMMYFAAATADADAEAVRVPVAPARPRPAAVYGELAVASV
jgi:hypothetical protein